MAASQEDKSHGKFLCGVIEGFYNRPWTREQRLDLFQKLGQWGLNSYLYAPKDDRKHRSSWRDLYTEQECRELQELVEAAREQGVTFYYGISPGQDMRYCENKEQELLLAKTQQLAKLGCRGFAVLWDDIEPELSDQDAEHFDSFAEAHCIVTNRLHEALGRPSMLLCPVEYCSSRAVPTVAASEYLATLGTTLHPDIQVFWTGSSVVSAKITASECGALATVLRRRPLLWDNLHANDYDQARVLLGPYTGREPKPREYLAGAMTNPNCEYSLNIPAILSLADWAGTTGHAWDPTGLSSQARAVTALLSESRRPAYGSGPQLSSDIQDTSTDDKECLTEEDLDLVCQMFWLPHSHGPVVERLLEDFTWCRDTAAAVRGWRKLQPGAQSDTVDTWLDRATRVSSISKHFAFICDKITKISNRELLYDLIPYLTNVRVILSACSNYLQWVGLRNCAKPLKCGPTLAGLPGGVAGDLQRLYPVQDTTQFPLRAPPPMSHFSILPFKWPGRLQSEVESCLGSEEQLQWVPLLNVASYTLLARHKGEVVGVLASWDRDKLECGDGVLPAYAKVVDRLEGVTTLVKLWGYRDSLCWLLEPSLLLQTLESVSGVQGEAGVLVSLQPAQHAIKALLTQLDFKTTTSSNLSGEHELLWRQL